VIDGLIGQIFDIFQRVLIERVALGAGDLVNEERGGRGGVCIA
jgi:hypothetical protein